jgi:hypothetical protein
MARPKAGERAGGPSTGEARAAVTTVDGKEVFVMATAPADTSLQAAILGEKADYWWVRIEVPATSAPAVDTEAGFAADLTQIDSQVVFSQNYVATWDPDPAQPPVSGYVVEKYAAGDAALTGVVGIQRKDAQLRISYLIEWEGMTDRFPGMGSVWHHRVIEGGGAAALEGGE